MKSSRFHLLVALLLSLALSSACAPSPSKDLTFNDIDGEFLDSTLIAVGTSRVDTSLMSQRGSMIFVRQDGSIKSLDHDGMDALVLAYRDGLLAFSDANHDYILGSRFPVRNRAKSSTMQRGIGLHEGSLFSVFNEGFGEAGYEMQVSQSLADEETSKLEVRNGWIINVTTCEDGVWALTSPEPFSTSHATVERLFPEHELKYEINIKTGELIWDATSCDGTKLTAVGMRGNDVNPADELVFDVDLSTGNTRITEISGLPEEMSPWNISVQADEIMALFKDADYQARHELWSIDRVTGEASLREVIAEDFPEEVRDRLYRVDGRYLYQLDVTRDSPSVLRAYDVVTGKVVKERKFDALDPIVNNPKAFDDAQESFKDFVVLTPVDKW